MYQKSNRPLFFVVSILVVLALLLSSCARATTEVPKAEPTKPAEEQKPQEEPTATVESLPPVELTYYYGGSAQADIEEVQKAMNEILKKKINATIKLNLIDWGAFNDKMNLMLTSKEPCDLIFTAPWINNYFQLVNNESLLALNDLLPKYAPELYKSIKPEHWNAVKVKGNIYAVPNKQIWVKPWGFWARKDLVDKFNFDYKSVNKWDDLDPFLKQILADGVIPWSGFPHFRHEIYGWDPLDDGIGYDDVSIVSTSALSPDLKAFNVIETPEFKGFVETMHKWYVAGYVPKEADPDVTASTKAGKYALGSHLVDPRTIGALRDQFGYDWVIQPLTNPVIMTTASVIATLTGVCASSKNPERALMYLNLINTDVELYNLFVFGIEGKHWVWKDKATKLIAPPEGKNWADTGYYPNTPWEYGNNFKAYYDNQDAASNDIWTMINQLNDSSTPSAALGFTFDRSTMQTEIANVKAAAQEFCKPLADGTADPETTLPTCIAKVKEAGVDKIIAEMQKQLDAFKAAKK